MKIPILSIMSGGALAQAAQLLAYPLIARLYLPQDFGIFFLLVSVISISMTMFTLQLEAAILAGRKSHIQLIGYVAFWVLLAGAVLYALLLLLFGDWLLRAINITWHVGYVMWYVPLGLFVHGLYALSISKTVRQKGYGKLAISHVTIALSTVVVQVLLGYFSLGVIGLLVCDFIARILGLLALNAPWNGWRIRSFSKSAVVKVLRRYKRFPLLLAPAAVLNVVSQNIQSLCFPFFFGAGQAGQLGLANKLVSAPVGLASSAAGHVFTGEFAASPTAEQQRKIVMDALYYLTAIALPLFSCFAFASEALLVHVLGAKWELVGAYAAILSLGLAASLVVSPISNIVIIRNTLSIAIVFSIAELVVRSLPYILMLIFDEFSPFKVVFFISAGNFILYGAALLRFCRVVDIHSAEYMARIRPLVFVWIFCFTPLAAAYVFSHGGLMVFWVMSAGLAVYFLYVIRKYASGQR